MGMVTWVLDGTVSTKLVGGSVVIAETGEALPYKQKLLKRHPG